MIAIHHIEGSFSEKWIEYCEDHSLPYLLIDIFDNDLITSLKQQRVTHLLFHVTTGEYKTHLILKSICLLLERSGIRVFPDYASYWHYDDKLSQKYLFEQLDLPHAPMKVFYSEDEANHWLENPENFPFVFKLRRGFGSHNVTLVKDKRQAQKLVRQMFGRGINPIPTVISDIGTKIRRRRNKQDWLKAILRFPTVFARNWRQKQCMPKESGYFLVQDFYPGNDFDTRVTIIGDKAMAFRRLTRPDDFRASGSGLVEYSDIDMEMVELAFEMSNKIGGNSLAFDFIYDKQRQPKMLEVSYCYTASLLKDSGCYWDRSLTRHEVAIQPEYEILQTLLNRSGG